MTAITNAARWSPMKIGRCRECQQEQVQRVDRSADDLAEDRVARLVSHLVRTHRAQPRFGLYRRQAIRRAAKPLQRLIRRTARHLAQSYTARGRSCAWTGRQGRKIERQ